MARELRDKSILELRIKGWTLQRIGEEYQLTRERVRQIIERQLDREKVEQNK